MQILSWLREFCQTQPHTHFFDLFLSSLTSHCHPRRGLISGVSQSADLLHVKCSVLLALAFSAERGFSLPPLSVALRQGHPPQPRFMGGHYSPAGAPSPGLTPASPGGAWISKGSMAGSRAPLVPARWVWAVHALCTLAQRPGWAQCICSLLPGNGNISVRHLS